MIICICANVSHKQIEELRHLPIEEVMMETSAGMCCGACMNALLEIVEPESTPLYANR